MRQKKRIFSAILAVIMVFSMVSPMALATDAEDVAKAKNDYEGKPLELPNDVTYADKYAEASAAESQMQTLMSIWYGVTVSVSYDGSTFTATFTKGTETETIDNFEVRVKDSVSPDKTAINAAKLTLSGGVTIPDVSYADDAAKATAATDAAQVELNRYSIGVTASVTHDGTAFKLTLTAGSETDTVSPFTVTLGAVPLNPDEQAIEMAIIALSSGVDIPHATYANDDARAVAATDAAQTVLDGYSINVTASVTHNGTAFVVALTANSESGTISSFDVRTLPSPDVTELWMAYLVLGDTYEIPHDDYADENAIATAAQVQMQFLLKNLWGIDVVVTVSHDGTGYTVTLTNDDGSKTLTSYDLRVAPAPGIIPLAKIAVGTKITIPYGTYTNADKATEATSVAQAILDDLNIIVTATVTHNGTIFELTLNDGTITETVTPVTVVIAPEPHAAAVAMAIIMLDSIGNELEIPFGSYADEDEKAAMAEEILTVFLQEICEIDVDVAVSYDSANSTYEVVLSSGVETESVTPFAVYAATAPVAPGMPRNVTATPGNGQITLTWAAPASDGGSQVTGYVLVINGGAPITLSPAQTSTTISQLPNGALCSITVAAENAVGIGAASAPVTATPVAPSTGGGSGGGTPSATTTTAKKEEHAPYMIGDDLGKFNPDGNMTRAEMAQMLYNLLDNSTKSTSTKSFSDVSVGDWYYEAVTALSAKGIINGYVDGTFRPDAAMTRSEFAALMVRFVESVTGKALTLGNKAFADVSADHWASEYIAAMSAVVGMTGYDAVFKPEQSITRAEVAEAANAMLDRVPDKKYIDSNPTVNKFPDVSADHWAYYEIMEASAKHGHTDAGAWIVG